MIRILSVADSIENTRYSVQRCVNTYSDYNVESMIAVPQFTGEDADEQTDIGEVLDYCFSQEKFDAIFIGMIREASAEATAIKQKAEADIAQERRKAVNELKDEIGSMAMDIAGKVIEREINEKDHTKLIDEFISNVGKA